MEETRYMPDTLTGDAWSGWVEERGHVCCHLKIWPLSLDSATYLLKALSISRGTCKHVTIAKQQQSFFLNYMTSREIIARNANHWIISGRDILKVLEITLFHCEVLRSTLFQYCKGCALHTQVTQLAIPMQQLSCRYNNCHCKGTNLSDWRENS